MCTVGHPGSGQKMPQRLSELSKKWNEIPDSQVITLGNERKCCLEAVAETLPVVFESLSHANFGELQMTEDSGARFLQCTPESTRSEYLTHRSSVIYSGISRCIYILHNYTLPPT